MWSILKIFCFLEAVLHASGFPNSHKGAAKPTATTSQQNSFSEARVYDVLIVGGGISGLSALSTLLKEGYTNVILLEAQESLGGRIKTLREGNVLIEEGSEWLNGDELNPLYAIAEETGHLAETLSEEEIEFEIYDNEGNEIDDSFGYDVAQELLEESFSNGETLTPYLGKSYGQFFLERFPEEYGPEVSSDEGKAWMHYLQSAVAYEEGTFDWLNISAKDMANYVSYDNAYKWHNGFDYIISHLSEGQNQWIKVSSPVMRIAWDIPGGNESTEALVVVDTPTDHYIAHRVLVTTSLAYLKEHYKRLFVPVLPKQMTDKFEYINLPSLEKIFIGWNPPFWGDGAIELVLVWMKKDLPEEMSWMYGISNLASIQNHKDVLCIYLAEPFASSMRDLSERTVRNHVMNLVSKIAGHAVEEPYFFKRTQWKNNPWIGGAYTSNITPLGEKQGINSRESYRTPLKASSGKEVLFWAGEHTHDSRFGLADGAYMSGMREATRLIKLLE